MHKRRKALGGPAAYTLGWTVRSEEFRMLLFESAKLLEERVVFLIGDLRILFEVVKIFVTTNFVTKRRDLFFD